MKLSLLFLLPLALSASAGVVGRDEWGYTCPTVTETSVSTTTTTSVKTSTVTITKTTTATATVTTCEKYGYTPGPYAS
jgi:hypothetical protein